MTTTFQKRQKEMKRIEKRKMKEEQRAQRKVDRNAPKDPSIHPNSDIATESEIAELRQQQ
jgi:hypothetical protein